MHKTPNLLILPFCTDAGTKLFVHKTPRPTLLCRGEHLCCTRKGGWMYALRGCVTRVVAVVTVLYLHYVHKEYICAQSMYLHYAPLQCRLHGCNVVTHWIVHPRCNWSIFYTLVLQIILPCNAQKTHPITKILCFCAQNPL